MRKYMNTAPVSIGIILLLLVLVCSAGCIKQIQNYTGGINGTQSESSEFTVIDPVSSQAGDPPGNSMGGSSSVAVTTPPGYIEVNEINPEPYVTSDPYKLPYRDLRNLSSGEPQRVVRIPQFMKKIVLRSNSTAFSVTVPQAPLIIDLTFSPLFESPDLTGPDLTVDTSRKYPPHKGEGGSEDEDEDEEHRELSGAYAFVYPQAEISIIDATTNETVAREGYGGIYSSDKKKKIMLYHAGSYIVTLKGDFIDSDLKITTGSAVVRTTIVTPSNTISEDEWEEDW
jgi:hypothetical protein